MPADEVTLVSTSDSPEQVRAALKMPEPPAVTPPAATPAAPAAAAAPAETTPVEPKAVPKDGPSPKEEGRIGKLTKEKYEAQARIEELERQLAAKGQPPAADAPPAADPAAAAAPTFDKPRPKQDDFSDFDAYLEARDAWSEERATFNASQQAESRVRAILEEQRKAAWMADQQRQAEQIRAAYYERCDATRAQFADYDEAMKAEHLNVKPEQIPGIRDFAFNEDNGPVIAYYLAKTPTEFERIAGLSYGRQLTELARLDAKLAAGLLQVPAAAAPSAIADVPAPAPTAVVPPPVVVRPAVSAAPMPPPRVPAGTGGGATPTTLQQLADTNNYQAFKANRANGRTH